MSHNWTWKALERVRHFCKLFTTQLKQKRIIDIFARCATKTDKRNEVQSLRAELKAHLLDLDSLDSRIAKRAVAALSLKQASCSHGELARHRRMPDVLIFVHSSVEHPVVERCFHFSEYL